MKTKPIELSEADAQQLWYGMQFAIKNLRESWEAGDAKAIMSPGAYKILMDNMTRIQTNMRDHSYSFEP